MNRLRLEFSHITKTAGTSIEQLAKDHGVLWGIENRSFWEALSDVASYKNLTGDPWHLPISYLEDAVLSTLLKERVFFCIVRNPYERVISEYYCRWGSKYFVDRQHIASKDPKEFNKNIVAALESLAYLRSSGKAFHLGHWQEQVRYVKKGGDFLLPRDNIIPFEELGTGSSKLFARYSYGFSDLKYRARCGAYPKLLGVEHLGRKALELVNFLYEEDFLAFGYPMRIAP
jgi:hypothetical protein